MNGYEQVYGYIHPPNQCRHVYGDLGRRDIRAVIIKMLATDEIWVLLVRIRHV